MAVSLLFDNVMESFTTTGTGTVTLLGAETGSQSFAVVGNLNTTVTTAWAVDANDNPSGAWEVAIGCTYTVSGTTMGRGTLLGSSTGSVISWAAGKKRIAQGIPALLFNYMYLGTKGAIQGLEQEYRSAGVIRIHAGTCAINDKVLSLAQTDYTSGSTMKDLSNATVTLVANSAYFTYLHDASGTLGARFEKSTGSGNGNDPDFRLDYDYWESPVGPIDRRIAPFWTDGSANIIPFDFINAGRYRRMVLIQADTKVLVSNGVSVSYAAVTLTPYIRSDALDYDLKDECIAQTIGVYMDHVLSIDGGTSDYENVFQATPVGYCLVPRYNQVPNTQALNYKVVGATNDNITLSICGVGFIV